jgi:hypothetical protein
MRLKGRADGRPLGLTEKLAAVTFVQLDAAHASWFAVRHAWNGARDRRRRAARTAEFATVHPPSVTRRPPERQRTHGTRRVTACLLTILGTTDHVISNPSVLSNLSGVYETRKATQGHPPRAALVSDYCV